MPEHSVDLRHFSLTHSHSLSLGHSLTLSTQQGEVDEDAVGCALDLKVAEEHIGSEEIERLVHNIRLPCTCATEMSVWEDRYSPLTHTHRVAETDRRPGERGRESRC